MHKHSLRTAIPFPKLFPEEVPLTHNIQQSIMNFHEWVNSQGKVPKFADIRTKMITVKIGFPAQGITLDLQGVSLDWIRDWSFISQEINKGCSHLIPVPSPHPVQPRIPNPWGDQPHPMELSISHTSPGMQPPKPGAGTQPCLWALEN